MGKNRENKKAKKGMSRYLLPPLVAVFTALVLMLVGALLISNGVLDEAQIESTGIICTAAASIVCGITAGKGAGEKRLLKVLAASLIYTIIILMLTNLGVNGYEQTAVYKTVAAAMLPSLISGALLGMRRRTRKRRAQHT